MSSATLNYLRGRVCRRLLGNPHEPAQGGAMPTRVCNSARWRHWGTCRARGVPGPSPRRRVRGWCRWLASSRRNWATLRSYGRPVYWRVMSVPTASRRVTRSGKAGTRHGGGRVTSYGPTRYEYYRDPEFDTKIPSAANWVRQRKDAPKGPLHRFPMTPGIWWGGTRPGAQAGQACLHGARLRVPAARDADADGRTGSDKRSPHRAVVERHRSRVRGVLAAGTGPIRRGHAFGWCSTTIRRMSRRRRGRT